jgi:hypothetical protein
MKAVNQNPDALEFADPKLQAEISSMSTACYQKK